MIHNGCRTVSLPDAAGEPFGRACGRHIRHREPAPDQVYVHRPVSMRVHQVSAEWGASHMPLSALDVTHVLLALAALMIIAHSLGTLFARFRQPRVIGEIAAGLVLGPTVLGHLAPSAEARLFPAAGATPAVLGAVYQLGLLLLLFCTGVEIRSAFSREEGKAVASISIAGMLVPFIAGLLALRFVHVVRYW